MKTIPRDFLYTAIQETRQIMEATRLLEQTVQVLNEEEDDGEREEFTLPSTQTYHEEASMTRNLEYLETLIGEHSAYQERLIKCFRQISQFIHPSRIQTYFDILSRFDSAVQKIDPTYTGSTFSDLETENKED